jgi:hypothetical protein
LSEIFFYDCSVPAIVFARGLGLPMALRQQSTKREVTGHG